MTALIVIGAIASYFAVGALYARSRAVAIYRRHTREWYGDVDPLALFMTFAWRVLFWPVAVVIDGAKVPVAAWFLRPVRVRKERAKQLRQDAAAWRSKQFNGSPTEREMAAELARLCEDRAKEHDL